MSSYLVTGGAGFIGSHLTEELVRRAHPVRRLFVRVRRHADAAQGRRHADQPAVALRASEAGGRAVLPDVHTPLRLRDRDDSLLQRVWTAAGSGVAVLRSHFSILGGAARG